jgi:hypothetical protein
MHRPSLTDALNGVFLYLSARGVIVSERTQDQQTFKAIRYLMRLAPIPPSPFPPFPRPDLTGEEPVWRMPFPERVGRGRSLPREASEEYVGMVGA